MHVWLAEIVVDNAKCDYMVVTVDGHIDHAVRGIVTAFGDTKYAVVNLRYISGDVIAGPGLETNLPF